MKWFLRLALLGMFTFLVVTVAAFRYLEWWQAILASGSTFLLLLYGAKVLIRTAIGRAGELFAGVFTVKSKVLRNATVDVHSVKPTAAPPDAENEDDDGDDDAPPRERNWFAFDVSIFPDPANEGPMRFWDLSDLRLVPFDTVVSPAACGADDCEGSELRDERLVENGVESPPDEAKYHGPRRLRFTAGVAKGVTAVKFRYYFEAFGRVNLPDPLFLPPARR